MNLSCVILPLTTPFAGDAVDAAGLAANIARYERHGVAGYLLLASTGEAVLLDENEKLEVLRAARTAIPPGKFMLAGVGLESTRATVRLAHKAGEVRGRRTARADTTRTTAVAGPTPPGLSARTRTQ